MAHQGVAKTPSTGSLSSPPQPTSGNYLITITSLHCLAPTGEDDTFKADGKGDEVYAAIYYRRFDRKTYAALEQGNLRTMVYGGSNGDATRIQSGSSTTAGGIRAGDVVPNNSSAQRSPNVPPSDSLFPFRLYQGALTDAVDALVISPSIWEYDGDSDNDYYIAWSQHQETLNQSVFYETSVQSRINSKAFGAITLAGNTAPPTRIVYPGMRRDTPIGLVNISAQSYGLPDTAVVLTREIIEKALSIPVEDPSTTLPDPGKDAIYHSLPAHTQNFAIMVIDFLDGVSRRAHYSMTLEIERM